jgi:predicted aldo/keto reductase-like oxidoreductase
MMHMEYRQLGDTGLEVGVVGLGTEHLEASVETWDAVLGMAAEHGPSYVDLLYTEPDYWDEFGPVLRPHRDRLVLAAHWGGGARYDLDYCRETFGRILSQVGNGYVEVAMMTMIDDGQRQGDAWRQASLAHLRELQAQGWVGQIGGSGHDPTIVRPTVESGMLDVLMFPVNMVDYDAPEAHAVYRACADHGVGLVAMKPYHGGRLFTAGGEPSGITPSQCLAYVLSLPVATTVPGPRTVQEYRDTLHYLVASEDERDYRPVVDGLHERLAGQCVYCHHCLPCPQGIEVGWMNWLVDQAHDGVTDELRSWYASYEVAASACTACGICAERCPFAVDAVARVQLAAALFDLGAAS